MAKSTVAATKTTERLAEVEAENTQLRLKLAKVKVCMEYFGSTRNLVFLELLAEHVKKV